MSSILPLTYVPSSSWNDVRGIPKNEPGSSHGQRPPTKDSFLGSVMNAFGVGQDAHSKEGGDKVVLNSRPTYCNYKPGAMECERQPGDRNPGEPTPYVFPKQDMRSVKTGVPRGRSCPNNKLVGVNSMPAPDPLEGDDVPHVYVSQGCTTVTPAVTPTELTRDTSYGKMLWNHPIYTYPEDTDRNAKAVGIIFENQLKTSNGFDDGHFQTFSKNTSDYINYPTY